MIPLKCERGYKMRSKENKKIIAVVDDESDILELISFNLKKDNFLVNTYQDGRIFLDDIKNNIPDLIILDIMLPNIDGYEVCRELKKNDNLSYIPIIMLSAKDEVIDKVIGLELGADDYLSKPFAPKELTARVKAVLRRKKDKNQKQIIIINDDLKINVEKYEVLFKDTKIDLTTTEFKILQILGQRKGVVFSREKLLDILWGDEKWVIDRTIDVHIRNLRKKLGTGADIIQNIRGIGYKVKE